MVWWGCKRKRKDWKRILVKVCFCRVFWWCCCRGEVENWIWILRKNGKIEGILWKWICSFVCNVGNFERSIVERVGKEREVI